jgi:CRP-like cAMP-binding protein
MDESMRFSPSYLEQPSEVPADPPEVLRSSALFAGLSESIFSRIASSSTRRTIARYGSLFAQKEEIRDLVLLESGNIKHTQAGPNGEEVLLRICAPGEIVAGPGFSGVSRHRYSARAIDESTVLSWRSEDIRNYMQLHPRFAINVNQILSTRLRELEARIREFTSEEATTRVALLLVRLSKQLGRAADEGIRIAITQDEIAQMAGLSMFTVSRMLSRWSDRGLVLTRRQAIIVPDVRRLARRHETKIAHHEAR